MARKAPRGLAVIVSICVMSGCGAAASHAADVTKPPKAVTLTINPDGTAVWDGEPVPNEPALKDKLARGTQQAPRLQLDLKFHSVGQLNDSNRQTLLDILELSAQFGYVHVETTSNGATLTVLGPSAADAAPAK